MRFVWSSIVRLWHYRLVVLTTCLVLGFFALIIISELMPEVSLGMAFTSFNIFNASVVTLAGTLVAILITAVFITTQYTTSNVARCKEALLKEEEWLRQSLRDGKLRNLSIYEDIEELSEFISGIAGAVPLDIEKEEFDKIYEKTTKAMRCVAEENKEKTSKLRETTERHIASDTSADSEHLRTLEEQTQLLEEQVIIADALMRHVYTVFYHVLQLFNFQTLVSSTNQLKKMVYFLVAVLIMAVVALILSGLQLQGVDVLSDSLRLYIAVYIAIVFVSAVLLMVETMSLNWSTIRFSIGVPLKE